jgi:hypothetical protein
MLELRLRFAPFRLDVGEEIKGIGGEGLRDYGRLDEIAVNVSQSRQGDFVKAFSLAWQLADPFNKELLLPAWIMLIEKYKLEKEG